MKTAITTYYDHSNYGAVLQAYALQHKIESFSHESCHISFSNGGEEAAASSGTEPPLVRMLRIHSEQRNASFRSFRDKYLHVKPFSEKLMAETDVFITGSDQVFNPSVPGWTDRFLLAFASGKRKCSYAASFGDNVRDKSLFGDNLRSFDRISVREESSVQTVVELAGKEAFRVLDPVFLLDESEWSAMADSSLTPTDKPYLLFVMVQNDMDAYRKVSEYAASCGLELKPITMSFFPPCGFGPWSGVGVEDYLKLIRDADRVVTSSFHALAFSIIFRKNFRMLELTGNLAERNCRQKELLDLLGLNVEDNGGNCLGKLAAERISSENWLKNNILRAN